MPKPVRPSSTASTAIATLRAGEVVVLGSMGQVIRRGLVAASSHDELSELACVSGTV